MLLPSLGRLPAWGDFAQPTSSASQLALAPAVLLSMQLGPTGTCLRAQLSPHPHPPAVAGDPRRQIRSSGDSASRQHVRVLGWPWGGEVLFQDQTRVIFSVPCTPTHVFVTLATWVSQDSPTLLLESFQDISPDLILRPYSWSLLSPPGRGGMRQLQACQGGCLWPATWLLLRAHGSLRCPPRRPVLVNSQGLLVHLQWLNFMLIGAHVHLPDPNSQRCPIDRQVPA